MRPDPLDRTVASLLREAGYETGMVGKSCVTGNVQAPEVPREKGFDYFFGTTSHVDGHFRFPKFVYENGKRIGLKGNRLKTGEVDDVGLYTGKALEFVEGRTGEKPFFLVVSYPVPHASLWAPEEDVERARPGIVDEVGYREKGSHYAPVEEVKATYAAMVMRLDEAVGELMGLLKRKGVRREHAGDVHE